MGAPPSLPLPARTCHWREGWDEAQLPLAGLGRRLGEAAHTQGRRLRRLLRGQVGGYAVSVRVEGMRKDAGQESATERERERERERKKERARERGMDQDPDPVTREADSRALLAEK